MYELGMSSDGRREPVFDDFTPTTGGSTASLENGSTYRTTPSDPFVLEEETGADAAAILMRAGIVVALVLGAFGGYKYHQGTTLDNQIAGQTRTDWAGRPLATNEQGDLIWPDGKAPRKIDLTTTASIKSRPTPKVIEAKPDLVSGKISADAKFHIVESGDTLSAISRKYKVSTAGIMEINKIENPRRIKPGMKLYVTR